MIFWGVSVLVLAVSIRILRALTTEKCKSTARLDGKTVLLTGGNAGIGKETALEIAKRGARLILASRNVERSKQVRDEIIQRTQNGNIEVRHLDLQSLESVRKLVSDLKATETRLDILINNAGTIGNRGMKTADGLDSVMQANHLGHFLLTNLLLDLLKKSAPSRIIVVSSEGHRLFNQYLNPKDLNDLPSSGYQMADEFRIYTVTKLCNVLMVREMAKRLQGTGVTVNAVHPGAIGTEIWVGVPTILKFVRDFILWPFFITANLGAQTTLHAAISEELENVSGKYFSNCKEAEISEMAQDDEIARTVWNTSAKNVGLEDKVTL